MNIIKNKRIIIALTGGIACYKVVELIRILRKYDVIITVIMTKNATNFITPLTIETISCSKVYINDDTVKYNMDHINLTRNHDLIIIVPATANIIAKLANGIADDFLSTMILARSCPLVLIPAMNKFMWNNNRTKSNISILLNDNVILIGPNFGEQACGEIGVGRMVEPEEILEYLIEFFSPKILKNMNILITAGPTIEPIDPIRYISNHSSGKTGYAIANSAKNAGAKVTLVTGPTYLKTPNNIKTVFINTANEMYESVIKNIDNIDVFISVAAVSDWYIKNININKIKKKSNYIPEFILHPTVDILSTVSETYDKIFCIGFAAETENIEEYAIKKLKEKKIDMIIANMATQVMNSDMTEFIIFNKDGQREFISNTSKIDAAMKLIEKIAMKVNK
ncbi:Coenzyme A biosynthesis bifunctional protein CoaBC [Candidatus Kinetoplastibacterium sorsogonicusi]|uniref:Coenzyme A biosynthesis bifunctional protein CoaBC n=1 Tax=Candidatus Kinetoplastidibacterium kentomonadis TaxID=1576550 RepID=A0A3Q8ER64_9PROT|nr:bifunctional phosphopantothenoylcysteine decarboxylase/phosphopantothenate--cysteine ligase CoaBC [Candidatus Kinetoplastibacterium sorsogonicusi]AWD32343.1 Coenzyme A biosynthesis bifunctional protein CoaBC [Candidatus Kinetoplastibacterium sorsogonicusi]